MKSKLEKCLEKIAKLPVALRGLTPGQIMKLPRAARARVLLKGNAPAFHRAQQRLVANLREKPIPYKVDPKRAKNQAQRYIAVDTAASRQVGKTRRLKLQAGRPDRPTGGSGAAAVRRSEQADEKLLRKYTPGKYKSHEKMEPWRARRLKREIRERLSRSAREGKPNLPG